MLAVRTQASSRVSVSPCPPSLSHVKSSKPIEMNSVVNPSWLLVFRFFLFPPYREHRNEPWKQFLDTGVIAVAIVNVDSNDLLNYLKLVSACFLDCSLRLYYVQTLAS